MNNRKYDDIIHLTHPTSAVHPPMPVAARAAQFSPFAALTGYDAAIAETARLTDARVELDEVRQSELNDRLQVIMARIEENPLVTVTYFKPDERKDGGSYVQVNGHIKKVDTCGHMIVMMDGTRISMDEIYEIEAEFIN